MRVAVVSSCYGGYDHLVDPMPQTVDCEYVLVTDVPANVNIWRNVVEPRPHMAPRMAAKIAKCRPDLYTNADITIWIDAAARLAGPDSVEKLVEAVGDNPIAQFVHPERQSIVAEAEVSLNFGKYAGHPVRQQVASYISEGYPDGYGLWATGCIVRNHRRKPATTVKVGDAWLLEQMLWTYQDQLSEPYVLWRHGVRPASLPGNLWQNPLVQFTTHGRDD